jgi:xanthine dehydrogenase D subunit
MTTATEVRTTAGIGTDAERPDGILKVTGRFSYSSDLWAEGMVWGATLRSPHPYARIRSVYIGPALALDGVRAVLTADDVPGEKRYGLEHPDQPVLAIDVVRYQGEPVAIVAADHPETARRACALIEVDYEPLRPVTDVSEALGHIPTPDGRPVAQLHPTGNLIRHLKIRKGDPEPRADVVVTGEYVVGMQDQAFLGTESGLAVPDGEGGVDLYVATQWLHADQRQVCSVLGLPPSQVRLTLAGVGGAFGGREDLSMHAHACMLALRIGRPVKMVYSREESFFGHVHRHPAELRYEHGFDRDGSLVYVRARILLDGGAYASSSSAVVANAGLMGVGPYVVPNVHLDCYGAYTNNPPCGAMRGFGTVQAAFAYEAQMDKAAAALGMDPVELRVRNALAEGEHAPTGQLIDSPAPVAELLRRVRDLPLPASSAGADVIELPGGAGNTTHGEGVRRGIGYGVGYKNVGFSEGFDDFSTARVRLEIIAGEPVATVHTAAAEVGQGLVTVEQQIARTELGVDRVVVQTSDTQIGGAGSSSASRQTYVTGGAVQAACARVRAKVAELAGAPYAAGALVDVLGEQVVEETVEWRHRPTVRVDPETGQGNAHVQYAFAAHRAVVDVDLELGLVKVVDLACAQDVGRAVNPKAVLGQIAGGSAQGLGLALMEEIVVENGLIKNPSFTDYLVPTLLDMPPMQIDVVEYPDPHAPYGLRGVGEPPTISSGPAILAAVRNATGLELTRVPLRPEHIAN